MPHLALLSLLALPSLALAQQEQPSWEGKPARAWAEQLAAADIRDRWYAAYALGQIGPPAAAEALAPLRKMLENREEQEYVRGNAAWALGRMRPEDDEVLQLFIKTLSETAHVSVRRNLAEALGNLGQRARPATTVLTKALEDADLVVRVNAAAALARIDAQSKGLGALLDMLRRGPEPAAYQAAVTLGGLGADTEQVCPALGDALRHSSPDVRRAAARSLGQTGKPALPTIGSALKGPDDEARRLAVEALAGMGPEALRPLVVALKNEHAAARRAAARALGLLGDEAKTAETELVAAVNDSDPAVRDAAAKALIKVRAAAEK